MIEWLLYVAQTQDDHYRQSTFLSFNSLPFSRLKRLAGIPWAHILSRDSWGREGGVGKGCPSECSSISRTDTAGQARKVPSLDRIDWGCSKLINGWRRDAHPNERRVRLRKAGPARRVPSFDRITLKVEI